MKVVAQEQKNYRKPSYRKSEFTWLSRTDVRPVRPVRPDEWLNVDATRSLTNLKYHQSEIDPAGGDHGAAQTASFTVDSTLGEFRVNESIGITAESSRDTWYDVTLSLFTKSILATNALCLR
jgi:hypothetical protein